MPSKFQEKDVVKSAALLSRAEKMLHRGGADLEAAGANTASKLCFARLLLRNGTGKNGLHWNICDFY